MKKIILPVLLATMGTAAGSAAGYFLRPADEPVAMPDDTPEAEPTYTEVAPAPVEEENKNVEYAKLSNQFVVPVVEDGQMKSLVIMTLSVEVPTGEKAAVFEVEPRLRDAFFSALIEHANIGGFDGNFTSSANMRSLREALFDASQTAVGPMISDVLILDIARQDV